MGRKVEDGWVAMSGKIGVHVHGQETRSMTSQPSRQMYRHIIHHLGTYHTASLLRLHPLTFLCEAFWQNMGIFNTTWEAPQTVLVVTKPGILIQNMIIS